MATGRDLAEMVDAEEARVEAEEQAEAEAQLTDAEQQELAERQKRAEYHLSRFFEFAGIGMPDDGVMCPVCKMGFIDHEMRYAAGDMQCGVCGGVGRTLTGSLVPGNDTRICPKCSGAGYQTADEKPQVVIPASPVGEHTEVWQAPVIPAVVPTTAV